MIVSDTELQQPAPRQIPAAFAALVAPETGMERQARTGRAWPAFLVAMACALLAAFAQASRVDATSVTLERLEKDQKLQTMSDKQIEDEALNARRLYQVGRVAKGALEAPAFLLLGGLAVVGMVWLARGKVKGRAVFPVAAAALLPNAIANLLDAIAAFEHPSLPLAGATLAPRTIGQIWMALGHPLEGVALKLGNVVDFYSLWAAIMMAFGIAFAGDVPVRRALWFTLCGWILWRLLLAVGMGG